MESRKHIKQYVFLLMALLIVMQYFVTPAVVIAQTITSQTDSLQLKTLKVEQQTPQAVVAQLAMQVDNQTATEKTESIQIDAAHLLDVTAITTQPGLRYSVKDNRIEVKLRPKMQGQVVLKLKVDPTILKSQTTLVARLNQQAVTANLTKNTVASQTEQSTASQQASSEKATSQSQSTATTTQSTQVKAEQPATKAAAQDIRELLEAAGIKPVTIIQEAKVTYLDKNGDPYPDQTDVPIDAQVHVSYTWSIPEAVLEKMQAGDYFDFKLPDGVEIKPCSGKLGEYGTYTVNADGTVHFEFNDKVATDHDIHGTFDYDAKFDKTVVPGDVVIKTPTEENFPELPIHIRPDYDQAIDKAGHLDKSPNPDKVIWELDINRPLNTMTDATVTDPMPSGTKFESVAIYPIKVDSQGNVIKPIDKSHPLQSGVDYQVDKNGKVTFIGKYAETNQAFQVVYTSKIDDQVKPENGGKVTFENTATLDDGVTETDASASVTAKYNKALDKKGPSSTGQDQTYEWEVNYNYNEVNHPKGAYIEDTMGDGLTLDQNSIVLHKVTFDADGKPTQGAALVEGVDYKLVPDPKNPNKFKVEFLNDIDYAVKINYQTKVNGYVDDPTKISNKVSNDTGDEAHSEGTANQQGIVKRIDGDIDYANREIPWKIDINNAGYQMENWHLTDQLSQGQTFLADTFQIMDKTTNQVVPKDQYTLVATKDGFKVAFKEPLKSGTNHKYQITYKSKFETSAIDDGTGHESDIQFDNDAIMNWEDANGGKHHNEVDPDFDPKPAFKYNGQKSGEYNATTKKITWTVAVNYNQQTLKNATIVDPIDGQQNYVAGSSHLYEATINQDGTYQLGAEVKQAAITEPTADHNEVKVNLPEGSRKAYVLVFETSLDGELIGNDQYKNTANFTNDGTSHDLTASVDVAHAGSIIEKTGHQDPNDSSYVIWDLMINNSGSTLDNVHIKDTPSTNVYIEQKDVVIYGTEVDKDGKIEKDENHILEAGKDYQIKVATDSVTGQQTIQIDFVDQIKAPYIVEYRGLITSDKHNETVTNKASIVAENNKVIKQDTETTTSVIVSGGTADGSKGSVTLEKLGTDGQKLAGAHLQLWIIGKDGKKDKLVREGDTNAAGQLKIGNLRVQDYLLVETKAPSGYTISNELLNGKRISIKADTDEQSFGIQKVQNEPTKVTVHKKGELLNANGQVTQSALAGAVFEVRTAAGKVVKGYEKLTVDQTGQLVIEKLTPGRYQLIEIKAPAGYVLDNAPIKFTVHQKDNGQIPAIDLGNKINYKGMAQLIKKAADGKVLAGAEFKVVNAQGKTIQWNLKSNQQGKVTVANLAPGTYQFVETKAPAGYVLNTKPVSFTIDAQHHGQQVVTASDNFINYRGSAVLVKEDKAGKRLAGAEFKVINAQGQTVQSGLTTNANGLVKVTDLAPGDYQFIETKAPAGYLINTQPAKFTIKAQADGQPALVHLKAAFINYQGAFQIVKVDTSYHSLKGAEFTLYDSNKKPLNKKVVSNNLGVVKFTDLAPGTYYYRETKAPILNNQAEYVVNDSLIKVVIPDHYVGDPQVFKLGDFQNFKGKAAVTKVVNEGEVSGAEFKLYRIDDGEESLVKTITVPANGKLAIDNLPVGDYKLVETKAAPGCLLNAQPIYFVINKNDQENPIVDNLNFPNYQVAIEGQKVNDHKAGLAGAVYQVFKADAQNQPVGSALTVLDAAGNETTDIKTNRLGKFIFKGLEVGHYVLVETKAPAGYILDTTPKPFTVEAQIGRPEAINLGSFVNYQGSVRLLKTDEQGQRLTGAHFKIVDAQGQTVKGQADLVSDAKGVVSATGLVPGHYSFVETKAPTGYLLNQMPIEFEIKASSAGQPEIVTASRQYINYRGSAQLIKTDADGHRLAGAHFKVIDAQGQTVRGQNDLVSDANGMVKALKLAPGHYSFVETKAPVGYVLNPTPVKFEIKASAVGKPAVVTATAHFVNYQGNARLIKTDDQGHRLAGAHFKVVDTQGQTVKGQSNLVSDANGMVKALKLAPGHYSFVETKAPAGYVLNTTPVAFEIKASVAGKPTVVTATAHFINYQGNAQLIKTDEQGQRLAGVHFKVVDAQGQTVKGQSDLVTDQDGVVKATNLAPGHYSFIETQTLTGYQLDQTPVKFEVKASAAGKPVIVQAGHFINRRIAKREPTKTPTDKDQPKSGQPSTKTPTGWLPQTGEQFMQWTIWIGIILVGLVGGIVVYRRKKD